MSKPWPQQQIQALKEHYLAGKDYADIAIALRVSKSAVCGQASRLRLAGELPPLHKVREMAVPFAAITNEAEERFIKAVNGRGGHAVIDLERGSSSFGQIYWPIARKMLAEKRQ